MALRPYVLLLKRHRLGELYDGVVDRMPLDSTCNCTCSVEHGRVRGADAATENLGTRNGHGFGKRHPPPSGEHRRPRPLALSLSSWAEGLRRSSQSGGQQALAEILSAEARSFVMTTHREEEVWHI